MAGKCLESRYRSGAGCVRSNQMDGAPGKPGVRGDLGGGGGLSCAWRTAHKEGGACDQIQGGRAHALVEGEGERKRHVIERRLLGGLGKLVGERVRCAMSVEQ